MIQKLKRKLKNEKFLKKNPKANNNITLGTINDDNKSK